jgi:hypothetical protein
LPLPLVAARKAAVEAAVELVRTLFSLLRKRLRAWEIFTQTRVLELRLWQLRRARFRLLRQVRRLTNKTKAT